MTTFPFDKSGEYPVQQNSEKWYNIIQKNPLGTNEFQSVSLLEAEFAIWAVDGFIRRYTGSDESHRAL